MDCSLSCRIVETPEKTAISISFDDFVDVAAQSGYDAVCLRASSWGLGAPAAELRRMREQVESRSMYVSMVTADYDVPLNNSDGPNSLCATPTPLHHRAPTRDPTCH